MRIYRYQPAVTLSAKEDIRLHRTTKASIAQVVIRNKTKSYSGDNTYSTDYVQRERVDLIGQKGIALEISIG